MKTDFSKAINHVRLFQALETPYIVFEANDPEFTILDENDAHARLVSLKRDDVINRPLLEVFPDNSEKYKKTGKSDLIESIRAAIKTRKSDVIKDLSYDIKGDKGNFVKRYWTVTHSPVFDEGGEVVAVYQSTEEITERRLAERNLADVKFQLEQALAYGSIGTWAWNIPKDVVVADENLAQMFGFKTTDAALGLPVANFLGSIHAADRERVGREIQQVLESHEQFETEYRTIAYDGSIRWVIARGRVELDDKGQPISFPGVIVDITDRVNAENNLNFLTRASTLFSTSLDYKVTLNNIASIIVPNIADWCLIDMLDENGSLESIVVAHENPKMIEKVKELRRRDAIKNFNKSTPVLDVLKSGKPKVYSDMSDDMIIRTAQTSDDVEFLRKIGFTSVMITPLVVNNNVIGTISFVSAESNFHYKEEDLEIANDLSYRAALAVDSAKLYESIQRELSERKRLQFEVEKANNELESRVKQRTKQLEQTNSGLKREIIKRHQAEEVLQEYSRELSRSNQELQDFAYIASHDLQEPLRKIQSFGDLLEVEYGDKIGDGSEYLSRMRTAASRMSTLIKDLLEFSRVTSKPHESILVDLNQIAQDVLVDLEDRIERTNGEVVLKKLPMVWADPTHMRQLFQNLIGNALKFHRQDVPPIVEVYTLAKKGDSDKVTIVVKDNGIGFDEKYLDRIFSVFQRLHGRDTYEGTGIGLAVCRKIVERYDGTITAESKKDIGSKFIITLLTKDKESDE